MLVNRRGREDCGSPSRSSCLGTGAPPPTSPDTGLFYGESTLHSIEATCCVQQLRPFRDKAEWMDKENPVGVVQTQREPRRGRNKGGRMDLGIERVENARPLISARAISAEPQCRTRRAHVWRDALMPGTGPQFSAPGPRAWHLESPGIGIVPADPSGAAYCCSCLPGINCPKRQ